MRVFIIDKHVLFRRCMLAYLQENKNISVVGEADSLEAACEILTENKIEMDILLIDLDLSNGYDTELFLKIQQSIENARIVILSEISIEAQLVQAIKIGASGYLEKDIEPETLVEMLFKIFKGEVAFPQNLLLEQIRSGEAWDNNSPNTYRDISLTKREIEVLQLVTYGLMDKQIADKLLVSENTVKNHMKSIRKKFGVSNRLQATMVAIEMGVISTELDN